MGRSLLDNGGLQPIGAEFQLEPVDQARDIPGAESVVDIHDGHITRATVQHSKQCSQTVEAGAVADAGRHGYHGRGNHSTYRARKRAFHTCANYHDSGGLQAFVIAEEPMNPSHADIVNGIDFVAHHLSRNAGFFGDGNVAGSGANNANCSLAPRFSIAPIPHGAAERKIFATLVLIEKALRHFGRGTRDQHVSGAREEFLRNGDDVIRALAETEYDFGHAVAQGAVMIDFGETDILEGHVTHSGESRIHVNRAPSDIIEKFSELVFCH